MADQVFTSEDWGAPMPEDKAWRQTLWMTKNGSPVRICDMTGVHVQYAHRTMRKNRATGIANGSTDRWIELFGMELKERRLDPLECPEEIKRSKEMLPGAVSDYIQKMGGALGRTPRSNDDVDRFRREVNERERRRAEEAYQNWQRRDRVMDARMRNEKPVDPAWDIVVDKKTSVPSAKERLEELRKQLAGAPIITPSSYRKATNERSRRVESDTLPPSLGPISVRDWSDLPRRANPGDLAVIVNTNEVAVYNDGGEWAAVAGRTFESRLDPMAKNDYGRASNSGVQLDVDWATPPKRKKAKKQEPPAIDPSVYGERKIRR